MKIFSHLRGATFAMRAWLLKLAPPATGTPGSGARKKSRKKLEKFNFFLFYKTIMLLEFFTPAFGQGAHLQAGALDFTGQM